MGKFSSFHNVEECLLLSFGSNCARTHMSYLSFNFIACSINICLDRKHSWNFADSFFTQQKRGEKNTKNEPNCEEYYYLHSYDMVACTMVLLSLQYFIRYENIWNLCDFFFDQNGMEWFFWHSCVQTLLNEHSVRKMSKWKRQNRKIYSHELKVTFNQHSLNINYETLYAYEIHFVDSIFGEMKKMPTNNCKILSIIFNCIIRAFIECFPSNVCDAVTEFSQTIWWCEHRIMSFI